MIFDEEKVKQLVLDWQESRDDKLLEEILRETAGLIEVIVSAFDSTYRDDMIQEAYIKVMATIYVYSPERGKLHSFLTSVIRNECSSYIQHVNRNLHISTDIIESGLIDKHKDSEYTDGSAEILEQLTVRNRRRFPSLPTTIIDPATECIVVALRDGIVGKSRGTISKLIEDFHIDRNSATVLYHSTLVYMRLSMLSKCDDKKLGDFKEFSLLTDFQDIVGCENCQDISMLFSGMYIKFP